jgi:cysteine desulfurase
VSAARWGVDLLSVSAHKIGGPAGIGALVCARHVPLVPLWGGGRQQSGRRPGTEAAWATAGFAAAATAAAADVERWATDVAPVGDRLRAGLVACGGRVFGDPDAHLGNTALVAFDGCDGHLVMVALDLAGFACSTGAACSTGTVEPSAVLLALGCAPAVARGALRFSIGPERTEADVDALCSALPDILASVRAATARLGAA